MVTALRLSVDLIVLSRRARVTKLDHSQISEIEQDARRVHASILFTLNGFSPINRLPPETLAMIPSFLFHGRDRIVTTHVCRHWRNTFLSTPALWDAVTAFYDPEQTAVHLERSGDIPLNVSIVAGGLDSMCRSASFRMLGQHSHRFGAMRLGKSFLDTEDVFSIMENPFPHLIKLELQIPDGGVIGGLEGPHPFPPLKSLTLDGGMRYLRRFQPSNLRKLGVGCYGWEFQLSSLLEFLATAPLLEELEFKINQIAEIDGLGDDVPPVVLKHLQRIVFRGSRPKHFRSFTCHIVHPHYTKIILTCYLPDNRDYAESYAFPSGMQLPIPTPPKYIRYRIVHDEDLLESSACIDLISVDGRHTLIENRRGWSRGHSPGAAKARATRELDSPCLDFLQNLDLSSVERFCFEGCNPGLITVENVMCTMAKLETLVVVDGDPYNILDGMQGLGQSHVICPLMRRLVVRDDPAKCISLHELAGVVETRAVRGSPLERVTMTSSFSDPFDESAVFVELLEGITEVRYDLGRNAVGWEWWKE